MSHLCCVYLCVLGGGAPLQMVAVGSLQSAVPNCEGSAHHLQERHPVAFEMQEGTQDICMKLSDMVKE